LLGQAVIVTGDPFLYHHDFHPPEEVRVFAVPISGLRRWDDVAAVYDVRLDDLVLRHYAFTDHWFAVNCTLDLGGRFVTEPGPIDWCFNCDISTPLFSAGNKLYSVDLSLDVLVGPNGRTYVVKDEDDFTRAIENEWLTVEEEAGARSGLAELLGIIKGNGLVAFLEKAFPFGEVTGSVRPPPMTKPRLAEVPLLHRDIRAAYFGRRLE
jgi:hypothetical protein